MQGGAERQQMRPAGGVEIQRLQALRRGAQGLGDRPGRLQAEGELRPELLQPGAPRRFERHHRHGGQQVGNHCRHPGVEPGLRGVQQQRRPAVRVQGQLGGALQERGGGGQATPGTHPAGGPREVLGDLLVRAGHRVRTVPGLPVRVLDRIGGLGQRPVRGAQRRGVGGPPGGRAGERMPEQHPAPDRDQPGRLRVGHRAQAGAEPFHGP